MFRVVKTLAVGMVAMVGLVLLFTQVQAFSKNYTEILSNRLDQDCFLKLRGREKKKMFSEKLT